MRDKDGHEVSGCRCRCRRRYWPRRAKELVATAHDVEKCSSLLTVLGKDALPGVYVVDRQRDTTKSGALVFADSAQLAGIFISSQQRIPPLSFQSS